MKKLFILVVSICAVMFLWCYQDEDFTGYTVKMVVTGNCPIVQIKTNRTGDYVDYYSLDESIDYESENRDGIRDGSAVTYFIDVYKLTGDATTSTATIYVDGVQVATQTTTAAYGHIRVEYTLQN